MNYTPIPETVLTKISEHMPHMLTMCNNYRQALTAGTGPAPSRADYPQRA